MKTFLIIVGCLVVFFVLQTMLTEQKNSEKEVNGSYAPSWISGIDSPDFVEISKALVKNNISGCGSYYIKKSTKWDNEYLVACTSDGETYNYHIVFTASGSVTSVSGKGITPPVQ